jgi:hypothetical protein
MPERDENQDFNVDISKTIYSMFLFVDHAYQNLRMLREQFNRLPLWPGPHLGKRGGSDKNKICCLRYNYVACHKIKTLWSRVILEKVNNPSFSKYIPGFM